MEESEYESISPLYMQQLKEQVEEALWSRFEKSKYRRVGEYIERWHEDARADRVAQVAHA